MKQRPLTLIYLLLMVYITLNGVGACTFKPCKKSNLNFPKAIIFDWDNTFTDAWPLLMETWNRTLIESGKPPATLKELQTFPHIPQEEIVVLMFGEKRPDVIKRFWVHYEHVHQGPIPLVPGVIELLKFLKEKGVYIAILSNQKGDVLRKNVKKAGLMPYVNKVVGAGDAPQNKPHRSSIEFSLNESQLILDPQDITYKIWLVGDSQTDLEGAANSGVLGIWITDKASQDIKISQEGKHPVLTLRTIPDLTNFLKTLQAK